MAKFHSLNTKEKTYIFDYDKNKTDPAPAKVIFKRFPVTGESFIDGETLKENATAIETNEVMKSYYLKFADECIETFTDFFVDEKEIKTATDILKISLDSFFAIMADIVKYAKKSDAFTVGELKA